MKGETQNFTCKICGNVQVLLVSVAKKRKTCSRPCRAELFSRTFKGQKWSTPPAMKGDENPRWKGGGLSSQGYKRISGKLEHRMVMEKKLGRKLKRKEVVHHWDENKINNSESNLKVFRHNAAHSRLHSFARRHKLPILSLKFS